MTFSGINQWISCTSSGGKFHLTPPNSADFPLGFHPQNPPLATAYRFESGHRHQKREPRPGVLFFGIQGGRTRTYPNATVRWTVAPRRFHRGFHSALESGCRNHCPKSLVFRGFGLFSFQFSRSGEKEILTDLRRRFLGITGEAIPIFCRRPDSFTNSLPFLSGFFQQDSLK